MLSLLFLIGLPYSIAFEPPGPGGTTVPVQRKCFSCTVFTAINNRLICTNPGTCYADYCYTYVLSNKQPMFLAGCAEDITDFPFRVNDDRMLCHTQKAVGLCVCRAGSDNCNQGKPDKLFWFDTDITRMNAISHKVAGFSADYAKSRVAQLLTTDLSFETFDGIQLSSTPCFSIYLIITLSAILLF